MIRGFTAQFSAALQFAVLCEREKCCTDSAQRFVIFGTQAIGRELVAKLWYMRRTSSSRFWVTPVCRCSEKWCAPLIPFQL